ncbi:hypothetical protein RchiOBHm_Chr1g0345011 [Rosa chinensis]|uniref:Uncharacterized protein n=1 Tax=Rosa chinensis TaxID=74649 RepID=A0A2P6SEP2_ROSCH|nr:hypothetical protein RchiOBHm_Chr1g0345011 [Rosa chinensis]
MTKLSHLRSSLQSYNIRQVSEGESMASAFKRQRDRRLTYAHEVESYIVGLEENTDRLVKELVEIKFPLFISSIGLVHRTYVVVLFSAFWACFGAT